VAEFNRAGPSLTGGAQGSIGNPKEQPFLAAGSNPSFHTTREKTHFPCLKGYSSHCGPLQAHLNEAGPQHHAQNMIILNLHARLSDRRKHIHSYSHSLCYPFWTIGCFDRHEQFSKIRPKRHAFRHKAIFRICFSD
jgi:hypothetical protein